MLVSMSHSSDRTDKLQQPASSQPAFTGYCLLPSWKGLVQGPWGSVPNLPGSSRANSSLQNIKMRMIRDGTSKEQHEKEQ